MANYYTDLNISTSEATGNNDDPYGFDQFQTIIANAATENNTYYIKGLGIYSSNITIHAGSKQITITSWIPANPPKFKFTDSGFILNGTNPNFATIIFNKILIQHDESDTSVAPITFSTIPFDLNLYNLFIYQSADQYCINLSPGSNGAVCEINIKGCSFIKTTGTNSFLNFNTTSSVGSMVLIIDSCYFEGNAEYLFSISGALGKTISGTHKYIAIYKNSSFIDYQTGSTGGPSWIDGGSNINASLTLTSALSNVGTDISLYTLPDDIMPINSISPNLIDVADPSLGLDDDIFGILRTIPDISCTEYVAPEVEPIVLDDKYQKKPLIINKYNYHNIDKIIKQLYKNNVEKKNVNNRDLDDIYKLIIKRNNEKNS